MKHLIIILVLVLSLVSCQDDLPCYVYNPDEVLITDAVDSELILDIVNDIRTFGYELDSEPDKFTTSMLNELTWDENLYKAAQLQSTYMYETENFDHFWCDGTTPNDRILLFSEGYIVAENIGWGYGDNTERIINAWLNSDGHRKNMLKKEFNVIGVANKGGNWTMVLGYKRNLSN